MTDGAPENTQNGSLLQAVPGLVRIAAGAWLRTTEWSVVASVRASERLARAAMSGESAAELLQEVSEELREQARRLLGVVDEAGDRVAEVVPDRPQSRRARAERGRQNASAKTLRERGTELLRQSADVRYEEPTHPAYERILTELAPDEGRILRLLALEGAQPALDIRTWRPLDVGSELVAPGLSMIGDEAGCRFLDRIPSYLNNLYRLGLIWFSREPLQDPLRYQVLEAQPDVVKAMRSAGRSRTVRRSIHLTPFGEDFCRVCLPLETAELEALPKEVAPELAPQHSGSEPPLATEPSKPPEGRPEPK
jgi:hypothetical protein